jgi:hypothetical protein
MQYPDWLSRWTAWLRENPTKQIRNISEDGKGNYCAAGVLECVTKGNGMPDDIVSHLIGNCVNWNDRERLTFPQIADKIEGWYNEYARKVVG